MIGRIVDRAISVVSPMRAAKRAHARRVYERISERGDYEAAKSDRLNANWTPTNRAPDLGLVSDADTVRARVRDLCRNNAYARGVLTALVRNVVGQGIIPQAKTENEEFNDRAEAVWKRWELRADVTGRLSFYEMQQLAYRETCEAGEVLVHFVRNTDRSAPVSLALELIDADRLAVDYLNRAKGQGGNEIRRGIELDDQGRPVAYHVYRTHPNDVNWRDWTIQRLPAENVLHLFRQERVGQTRGMSLFAPVVRWLKDLGYYVENELQASAVASCFTAAIKTIDGPASGSIVDADDTDSQDRHGNTFEYLQPGMVARLFPGESVETIDPSRPNSQAGPWIDLILRSIAVGTGLSYERLTRDYSRTTFSSNRAADLEDRRSFRPEQDWLVRKLCIPVWERFVTLAAVEGVDGFPSAESLILESDEWLRHEWQTPGWEWVDPEKEANASIAAINANLSTLAEELGKRGRDLRETLKQRSREMAMLEEFGLRMDSPEAAAGDKAETEDEEEVANAAS